MALPDDWSLVTVTGTYTNLDGTPALGSILFHSDQVVVIGGVTVVPRTTVIPLEADGTFIAQLPSTNDPGLSLTGWAYRVVENITNGRAPYHVFLQHEGGPYDMATIDHVVPPDQLLSTRGQAGLSAYETAVAGGFVGSESDWLLSMQGEAGLPGLSAYQIAVAEGFIGTEAEWLASLEGEIGPAGASAYAAAVAGGYPNNETEWLASLKGDKGDAGTNGDSGYTVAVNNGFVGTEAEWLLSIRGDDGASAYDSAVAGGFIGTSAEWIASLQGASAYASAVATGFVGTEAEWIASIPGEDGTDGDSGYAVAVAEGFVGTEAEWLVSLVGKSAYQSALDNGFVGTEAEWVASLPGTDGLDGDSGYQVALDNGFVGTAAEWLASLQGSDGDSAYEVAVADGFVGTITEWLASLVGPEGPPGGGGGETLGTEILPAFGGAGWDTTGTTPPAINATGAHFVGASGLSSARHTTLALDPAAEYEVTYTVSNYSAGSAQVVLYSADMEFVGTARTANGTYTERLTATGVGGVSNQIRFRCIGTSTFDITEPSVKEVTVGGSSASLEFTAAGTGAATRTLPDKARERVSIKDYLLPAHGTNYSPALVAAMAASKTVYFPRGTYTFLTPVDYLDGVSLYGEGELTRVSQVGARIIANNGFIKNSSATVRKSIHVSNLEIEGNGTGIAIAGPFGGEIRQCKFVDHAKCIENAFGYLSRYIACTFEEAAYGIHLAVSNGCRIDDCWFAADCIRAFDTVTLPAADVSGGGYTGALPMVFTNNNVNQGNAGGSGVLSVYFSGLVIGFGNYFEDYSTAYTGNVFVEYEVHRFAGGSFRWYTNEMNCQGNALYAMRLVGSTAGACDGNGIITGNRFNGITVPIRYGTDAGANNYIQKMRVFDNNNDAISNQDPRGIYRPMVDCGFDTTVSITGADVTLPIAQDTHFDNCTGVISAGNIVRPRKAGRYRITGDVSLRTVSSNYGNINVWLDHGGVDIARTRTGVQFMTGGGQTSAHVTCIRNCADGDSITLHAGNGDTATRGRVTLEWLGNDSQ